MTVFPLQNDLIDAVVQFASEKLTSPEQARQSFSDILRTDSLPTLKTCRIIQKEVRDWLCDPQLGYNTQVKEYNVSMERYTNCLQAYIDNATQDIRMIRKRIDRQLEEWKRP